MPTAANFVLRFCKAFCSMGTVAFLSRPGKHSEPKPHVIAVWRLHHWENFFSALQSLFPAHSSKVKTSLSREVPFSTRAQLATTKSVVGDGASKRGHHARVFSGRRVGRGIIIPGSFAEMPSLFILLRAEERGENLVGKMLQVQRWALHAGRCIPMAAYCLYPTSASQTVKVNLVKCKSKLCINAQRLRDVTITSSVFVAATHKFLEFHVLAA